MQVYPWLRQMLGHVRNRRSRKPRPAPRCRPRLEALEDRWLLSTLTVLNTNDNGPGSLRAEIAAAKSGDRINFDRSLNGQTIVLTSGELAIYKSLDIEGNLGNFGFGNSQPLIGISGNGASRVFDIAAGTIVTLDALGIIDGVAAQGGGILNQGGNLTLSNDYVYGNEAITSSGANPMGGGIDNAAGSLTIIQSALAVNRAQGASDDPSATGSGLGGAIYNAAGATLSISGSDIESNVAVGGMVPNTNGLGGAICAAGGNVTLTNDTLSNNVSAVFNYGVARGGAIYIGGGSFSITNCSLEQNHEDVEFNVAGPVPQGGAIYQAGGTLTVGNTLFNFNFTSGQSLVSTFQGGAIYQAAGNLTVTNSTFTNNFNAGAVSQGNAIYIASGNLTIQNCAFEDVANEIYIAGGSVCVTSNTTFGGTKVSLGDPDVIGVFTIC